jgi:hypothetical protein
VQVDWYRFITIYLTVIVVPYSTYISGQLDGEKIGGFSHLLFVAGEHREV